MGVAGIGGANVDIHGRSDKKPRLRDSNPGHIHLSAGGVLRNILENLARLSVSVELVAPCGEDSLAVLLRRKCTGAGIGTRGLFVRPGHRTSVYLSVLDREGDMLLGMSDMEIVKSLAPEDITPYLPLLQSAEAVVCDGNLPQMLFPFLKEKLSAPLFADPVSVAWAREMAPHAGLFYAMKPNRLEAEAMTGVAIESASSLQEAADRLLATGLQKVFISLGEEGLFYKDRQGQAVHKKALLPKDYLRNATGAGDAAMAGIVYSHLQGYTPEQSVAFALGAAAVSLGAEDTISADMGPELVEKIAREWVV